MEEILRKLDEIKAITLLSQKDALTVDDVVYLTGLSKGYLYKLCQANKIPYYKSSGGKYIYFKKEEVNEWMLDSKVYSVKEIAEKAKSYRWKRIDLWRTE